MTIVIVSIVLCVYLLSRFLHIHFIVLLLLLYILLTILIIMVVYYHKHDEYIKYPLYKKSKIPNVIYTYWHSKKIPPFVQYCIYSWKKYNPRYNIHVITEDNISNYIPFSVSHWKNAETQKRVSDFIRLYMLSKYGGIWLDASILLNKPLDWIHAYQVAEKSEYVGYKINLFSKTKPVIESWFMAAISDSEFMKDWYNEFDRLNTYPSVKEYVDDVAKTTNLQAVLDPYYLAIHVSCLHVNEKKSYRTSLLTAEYGPYLCVATSLWIPIFLPFLLFVFKGAESPLVKYRGGERDFIEDYGFLHVLRYLRR